MGLKTARELCLRSPLLMDGDLLKVCLEHRCMFLPGVAGTRAYACAASSCGSALLLVAGL